MELSKFHHCFESDCLTNYEVSCILDTTDTSFLHPWPFKEETWTVRGTIVKGRMKADIICGQILKITIKDDSEELEITAFDNYAEVLKKHLAVGNIYFMSFNLYDSTVDKGNIRVFIKN